MIYAAQIAPERQTALDPEWYFPHVGVFGNRRFREHLPDVVKYTKNEISNGTILPDEDEKDPVTFVRERFGSYFEHSLDESQALEVIGILGEPREYITEWGRLCMCHDTLCRILTVCTGHEWAWETITGGHDWQYIVFDADEFSRESLSDYECEYFNEGTEWELYRSTVGDIADPARDEWLTSFYAHDVWGPNILREMNDALCLPEQVSRLIEHEL